MNDYAPEYTNKERIALILKHSAWLIPLYVISEIWFFDWLAKFSHNANCYQYGGINGVYFLMYGLFVGMPLSLALLLTLLEGRRAIAVIQVGQNPLPQEKVFTKTKYKYGLKAKVKPVGLLCSISLLILLSLWGVIQAKELTANISPCEKPLTLPNRIAPPISPSN